MTSVTIQTNDILNLSVQELGAVPNIQVQGSATEVSVSPFSEVSSISLNSVSQPLVVSVLPEDSTQIDLNPFQDVSSLDIAVSTQPLSIGISSDTTTNIALSSPSFVSDVVISHLLPTSIQISKDVISPGSADLTSLTNTVNNLQTTVNTLVNKKPVVPSSTNSGNDVSSGISGNFLSGATDSDNDTLRVTGVSFGIQSFSIGTTYQAPYGSFNISSTGIYNFVPNAAAHALTSGQSTTQVFTVITSDGQGANVTSTLTITIIGQNNSPIALVDYNVIPYNSRISGNVLSNDYNPDGGSVSLIGFSVNGSSYSAGQTATIVDVGTLTIDSVGAYSFVSQPGFSGSVPSIVYTISNTNSQQSTGNLVLNVAPAPSTVIADPVTSAITGSHATYNVYSDSDMNSIPWGALQAGDVVNIHWKASPYRAKIGLRAQGTQQNPVVINGVTDASGNRPIFDWSASAFTAAGCNPSGTFSGAQDVFGSTPEYGEGLGGFVIKRGIMDPGGSYVPKWIQIKNLELRSAKANYTSLGGSSVPFVGSGGLGQGIYVLMSEDLLIDNCVIHDHGIGIFVQANNQELAYTSNRPVIRNCRVYDNGVAGSFLEHNIYLQAASPIVEGCYLGQLRPGATGSTYKSRSSGEIFRYNWVVASSRAIDFVQSEDNTNGIAAQADMPITWCYGNVIINDENSPRPSAYVPLHFGGDTGGEQEGSSSLYVPPTSYRNQLYFWNNTYYQRKTTATMYKTVFFDLSLRDTRVDAWNNVFVAVGNSTFSWVEHAGILNLHGNNCVYGTINDAIAEANAVNYQVNKIGTLLNSDPLFVNASNHDFFLEYSSPVIDIAGPAPSGLPDTSIDSSKPVEYQPRKASNGWIVRVKDGNYFDLGATEYGIGYTPSPPPSPSVSVIPSIVGSKVQGSTLSINNGTWVGRPNFTYQWKREGVNIPGETGGSFTTSGLDFHTNITCTVTGTNLTGSASATTASVYIISNLAPINSVAPVITGTVTEGYTLSCSTGVWSNSPTGYSYQWLLDGSDIVGATASSYQLQIGQGNHYISCRVTATNASDSNSEVSSSQLVDKAPADPDPQGTWNFSADNGTTIGSMGGGWQNGSSSGLARFECMNGALQCVAGTGSNGEAVWLPVATEDSYSEAKILANWGGDFRFGLRASASSGGYAVNVQPGNVHFYRAGAYQNSYAHSASTSADLYVKLSYVSNVFSVYINGSLIFTYTENGTPITGGGISIGMVPGNDVSLRRLDYLKTANV